jgi:hypothetical protein
MTLCGRFISESDIQNFKQIDDEVLKQFKVVYKEGKLRKVEIYSLLKWRNEMYPISEGRIRKYKSRRCNKDFGLEETFKGL